MAETTKVAQADAARWRNRIIETGMIDASELRPHPLNPRLHPPHQRQAVEGLLDEIGIVDTLTIYDSPKYGKNTVIDGHLRQMLGGRWPYNKLDVSDEEALVILATFDHTTGQANIDGVALGDLLAQVELDEVENLAVLALLSEINEDAEALAATTLAAVQPAVGRRTSYGVVVKLVVVAEDVAQLERAIAATGEANRAQAILVICQHFLETSREKRQ